VFKERQGARAFLAAIGKTRDQDDPSNKLVAVDAQLAWLSGLGMVSAVRYISAWCVNRQVELVRA